MFNSLSYICLIACVLVLSRRTLQLPVSEQEVPDQSKDVSKIVASGNSDLEENDNDPPVYIMVPVVGDRPRRGAENGNVVNLDNGSYEIPTFIKFNESAKGDIEVALIPSPDNHVSAAPAAPAAPQNANANGFGNNGGPGSNGVPGNNVNCLPINSQTMKPICLTFSIDGIIPPGKKVAVSNSSEIRGSGAVLKIRFTEAKDECMRTSDLLGAGVEQSLKQRLETQKKRKFNDEDEEEESATTQLIDQKTLQELIFKILTSNKVPSTTSPTEEVVFIERFTTEPSFSFLINPSILQKISAKRTTSTRKMTTLPSQNSPDFDTLLKTVEHITATMPKEKLLSLLSSLINKAALNKEMSTNQ